MSFKFLMEVTDFVSIVTTFVCLCSLVQFHPDIDRLQLLSSSLDCGIRLWDLRTSQCVCVLQSHYSAVTSLSFSSDGNTMVRYWAL